MALQYSSSVTSNTGWLKKPAVKTIGVFVAGLFAIVTLLVNPFSSKGKTAGNGFSQNKPASSGSGSCSDQKKQVSSSSSFSLMPGRLNRFLQ